MIGFDLDETIFNTGHMIRTFFLSKYNTDIYPRFNHNVAIPHVYESRIVEEVNYALNTHWESIYPYPNAIEGLVLIYNITFRPIIFITARQEALRESTIKLLDRYMGVIPYVLYHAKTSEKQHTIQTLGLKYFVDDRISVIKNCRDICEYSFLLNRQWNLTRNISGNVIRVNHITDVYHQLSNIWRDYDSTRIT